MDRFLNYLSESGGFLLLTKIPLILYLHILLDE